MGHVELARASRHHDDRGDEAGSHQHEKGISARAQSGGVALGHGEGGRFDTV